MGKILFILFILSALISDFGFLSDFGFRTSDFGSPSKKPLSMSWRGV